MMSPTARALSAASILLCLVLVLPAAGQTTFGSITGTVTDRTGAVIPGANVTATNEGTGLERSVQTTAAGVFNVPNLNVGRYRVRVAAQGFRDYERAGLALDANAVLGLDVQLTVAGIAESVEVVGAAPVINTETSTLAYVKTSRDLQQLPMVTRTAGDGGYYGFTYLNPGVSKIAGQAAPAVNGMRVNDTTPTMDGIVVMAYPTGVGGGPVQLGMEGIEQVNIELAGTQAEFGRAANFTVVSKSGTNQLHGGAYYDHNGNRLNARNFFSSMVPFRVYHDFAGSLGGPIRKNKAFFFADYEGSREAATAVLVGNTPLPPWRTGDFTTGVSKTIVDPTNGRPFPNNQVPAARVSPVSKKVQDFFFPLPNYGPPGLQSGNWRGQAPGLTGYTHYDNVDARVDHHISDHDQVFGRVSYRRLPTPGHDNNLAPVGAWFEMRGSRSAVLSWTHTFSPTLVNEARTGMARMRLENTPSFIGSDIIEMVGIQGITAKGIPDRPVFNITGITSAVGDEKKKLSIDTNFQWTDNLSLTRGSHLLKFGFDAIRDQLSRDWPPNDIYGTYNFNGAFTGFGYADFLLGIPQTTTRTVATPESYLRGTMWSLYAQDQYKLSRKLTLNLGLRWELQGPYYDRFGDIFSFDRKNGAIVVPDSGLSRVNPLYPKNLPIITASQAGYPANSLVDFRKTNFYPRFGFAYRPLAGDKLVIRGGYGIFGNTIYGSMGTGRVGGPFAGNESFTNKITDGVPLFSFPNPFLSVGTTSTQNISGVNPRVRTPYAQQFTLTVERQLGQIGIRVAYVGTRGVNLLYRANINQPPPSAIPFTNNRRLYPLYNVITWFDNGGTEQYNALQISASKTYGNNLFFNTGWTWAKDLTDTQDTGATIQDTYNRRIERGDHVTTRPHRVYVTAIYALPIGRNQRILSNPGRVLNAVLGGWSTSWVSMMQTGSYFTPSFSGFDPSNTNNIGGRPDRIGSGKLSSGQSITRFFDASAFMIPGCPTSNPVCSNPANVGRFGNSGVNILRGPKYIDFDFSAMKDFHINDRALVRFRMLATNVFNHPNFANPAANISSPGTVGQITSAFGEVLGQITRRIHFSLRLEF